MVSDQEVRMYAIQMAVKFHEGTGLSEMDLVPFAQEIYKFITGETK